MVEDHEVKEMLVEIMLTGDVELLGRKYNSNKLAVWARLIKYNFVTLEVIRSEQTLGKPKLTPKGRAWLDEQRS